MGQFVDLSFRVCNPDQSWKRVGVWLGREDEGFQSFSTYLAKGTFGACLPYSS